MALDSFKSLGSSTPQLRWRFVLHALLWLGLLYAALYYPWPQGSWPVQALSDYLKFLALVVGKSLFWLDPTPRVNGDIVSGAFNMQVVLDCGALDVWAMLSAAILATPVPWTRRIIGVFLGTLCIFVANVVRLCALYLIGVWSPEHFHVFHEDVFSFGFVVYTLGIFALWLWYPGNKGGHPGNGPNDGPTDGPKDNGSALDEASQVTKHPNSKSDGLSPALSIPAKATPDGSHA